MIKTFSTNTIKLAGVAFLFSTLALFAFASQALAFEGSGSGFELDGGKDNRASSALERIGQLEKKIAELKAKRDQFTGGSKKGNGNDERPSGSSGSSGGMYPIGQVCEKWKDRPTTTSPLPSSYNRVCEKWSDRSTTTQSRPGDAHDRICERWKDRASTTPSNAERICEKWKDRATTTPPIGRICEEWSDRPTTTSSRPNYERVCEKWKDRPTTTPSRPGDSDDHGHEKPTSTSAVILMHPNGGTVYKNRISGAVLIQWKDPVGLEKMKIVLEKNGTSSVVIAENINLKPVTTSRDRSHSLGSGWKGGGNSQGRESGSQVHSATTYNWKDAPTGTGYKISLTGTKGSSTYTDKSDETFSIERATKGQGGASRSGSNDSDHDGHAHGGSVMGADTSYEVELLDELHGTLLDLLDIAYNLAQ